MVSTGRIYVLQSKMLELGAEALFSRAFWSFRDQRPAVSRVRKWCCVLPQQEPQKILHEAVREGFHSSWQQRSAAARGRFWFNQRVALNFLRATIVHFSANTWWRHDL